MLSVQQRGIKYHFLSLWYDLTCDWTLAFQTIGKHSTLTSGLVVSIKVSSLGQIELFNLLHRIIIIIIIIISYLKSYIYMQVIHILLEYLINRNTNIE